ncbi:MlaE family lipid ABC transporter permease subunit [Sulfurimonas sp.]|uniref:ABC transporter permease n=1 Tax=Sulfurimonas sp. TaxID=2022749 RepID=UPI0026337797|nr:MlaE family lipid ABC transporter permease subunit [Sulfurimonas sp.]
MQKTLTIHLDDNKLLLKFQGELTLYKIARYEKSVDEINQELVKEVYIDLDELTYIDTAAAIFIHNIENKFHNKAVKLQCKNKTFQSTLKLVEHNLQNYKEFKTPPNISLIEKVGKIFFNYYSGFIAFIEFFGRLFATNIQYLTCWKNIRLKEIAFEINESAFKALGIVALTSFLIGLVIAYQSAYQLKIYGANIYIVDMLGISIFRELAPVITAIVIAGRSGSAYTAQIGSMKITQELDAMRTMGFEPFAFLVVPRIVALVIMMPLLIFVADIMAILGGMIVANVDLNITPELFIDRLNRVVAAKHFFVGIVKGPFFAFLIASIGIYRGLIVKDDTQSIGFNTTKSVVESIFAVIVCDAVFSIAFTNLGI